MSTTYTHTAPTGGEDIPLYAGALKPILGLQNLALDSGTTKVTVEVTPSDVVTPLGRTPWFGIFVNDSLEAIGQLDDAETLTLQDFAVSDTDKINIKWRSAFGVTNRLLQNETARTIITMGTN